MVWRLDSSVLYSSQRARFCRVSLWYGLYHFSGNQLCWVRTVHTCDVALQSANLAVRGLTIKTNGWRRTQHTLETLWDSLVFHLPLSMIREEIAQILTDQ